jgi:hypothetical protein
MEIRERRDKARWEGHGDGDGASYGDEITSKIVIERVA